jgi:hypothetical protein
MSPAQKVYYTRSFGSMGATLDTVLQTPFFQWFHLAETERHPQEPGYLVRFRPSGDKFHQLCYLDVLMTAGGEMVRMELVVQRRFIQGPDSPFAQDLVKSFLLGVLPDACQSLLQDFLEEIQTFGREGSTQGFKVFRGRQDTWSALTGWTRLELTNLPVSGAPSLVVRAAANPKAPNAKLVQGEKSMVRNTELSDGKRAFFWSLLGLGSLAACAVVFLNPTLLEAVLRGAQQNGTGAGIGIFLLFGFLANQIAGEASTPVWLRSVACLSLFFADLAFFALVVYMGAWFLLVPAALLFFGWMKSGRPKLTWREFNGN